MEFTKKDLNSTLWVKPEVLDKSRKWYVVDAKGKTLGKLAVIIANKLNWKEKAHLNSFWDCGDFVIVKNAAHIKVTWDKLNQKMYYRYSGYKWNLKEMNLSELLEKHPERAITYAVKGMIPKNKLRDKKLKRLKVFAEESSKYNHLNPEQIN